MEVLISHERVPSQFHSRAGSVVILLIWIRSCRQQQLRYFGVPRPDRLQQRRSSVDDRHVVHLERITLENLENELNASGATGSQQALSLSLVNIYPIADLHSHVWPPGPVPLVIKLKRTP